MEADELTPVLEELDAVEDDSPPGRQAPQPPQSHSASSADGATGDDVNAAVAIALTADDNDETDDEWGTDVIFQAALQRSMGPLESQDQRESEEDVVRHPNASRHIDILTSRIRTQPLCMPAYHDL